MHLKILHLTLSFLILSVYGQVKKVGIPTIHNYSSITYSAGTQNWSIDQDKLGVMYFANNDGLLTFDGSKWDLHFMPNKSIVRSVFIHESDNIYAGAYNEFGYFQPSCETGELTYYSLSDVLIDSIGNFGEIWRIDTLDGEIYFQSFSYILKVDKSGGLEVFEHDGLQYMEWVQGNLLINIEGVGLGKISGLRWEILPGGEFFADKLVKAFMETADGLVVGTEEDGLFLLNNTPVQWQKGISDIAAQNQLYAVERIGKDFFAVGTISNGVYIINSSGEIFQHLNIDKGIQNNSILSVFTDREQNLWLGLDNGIDYVNLNSPISYVNSPNLLGACYTSYLKGENLYLGTNQGLYLHDWYKFRNSVKSTDDDFNMILSGQIWSLKEMDGKVFCGHNDGTFIIEGDKAKQISEVKGGWQYHYWPTDSNILLASTFTGISIFRKSNNQWKFIKELEGFEESCTDFEIDRDGVLWLAHRYKGLFRIELDKGLNSIKSIEFFDERAGLITSYFNSLLNYQGDIYVSSGYGLFQYNAGSKKFEPNNEMSELLGKRKINKLYRDEIDNYWYFYDRGVGVLRLNFDGTYNNYTLPYFDVQRIFLPNFEHINYISETDLIIASRNGFLHFNPKLTANIHKSFSTYIRMIQANEQKLIYGHSRCLNIKYSDLIAGNSYYTELPYKQNNIYARVGTDYYENLSSVEYQYWLEGQALGWTDWTVSPEISFNDLREGNYVLHIRARNEFEKFSNEAMFSFIINPPWHRSGVAFSAYIALSVVVFILITITIIRKVERDKENLRKRQQEELIQHQKQFEKESLIAEQEIVKLRNENLKIEIDKKKAELESKSKELGSIVMQASYKNDLLTRIKNRLSKVTQQMLHEESKKEVQKLVSVIDNELDQKEDWKKFEVHFDEVHENFIQRLRQKHPDLTPKDLKLAAYLRMNLSTKEIAPLLNVSLRGVETGRYRLRKKIGLDRTSNLIDYFLQI